jgi:pseudaminic acid synthase
MRTERLARDGAEITGVDKRMNKIEISGKSVGDGAPVFVVAEMSANHDRDLDQALALIDIAAASGADAVKLQTYSADSLSIRTAHPSARVNPNWGAETLYDLYVKAAMPMEFHPPLFARARELGLIMFSSVFDEAGVDYLETLNVPVYKVASPELVHIPLLRHIGQTGKPVIVSTGMASIGEVEEAVEALTAAGSDQIALLHCCSVYPADPATVNLNAMATLRQVFQCPIGFSDHTLGIAVPIAAAALGANIIEKHFTNDVARPGPDHRFSLAQAQLAAMVEGVRQVTAARGSGRKVMAAQEAENRAVARRSLFAVVDIPAGVTVTAEMVKVVRPGSGIHPRWLDMAVGRLARRDIKAGSPITWEDV